MTTDYRELRLTLKKHSKSCTLPRMRIFDVLARGEPISMQALVHAVSADIDRASVYRTIRLFERIGVVHRIALGWKYTIELADAFQPHHHHMTCQQCGQIIPINDYTALEDIIATYARHASFKLMSHQVELQGVCSMCAVSTKT